MAGFSDAFFMQKALEQANLAYEKDEVPVGAILVKNNEVLSEAHNLSITKNDPSAHAEILCLKEHFQHQLRLLQTLTNLVILGLQLQKRPIGK